MPGSSDTIRTPRLTLRPLEPGDAPAITAGVGNYDVARWLAVVPYPYAPEDAESFLASGAAAPGACWAICDAGGLQGLISVGAEMGYWLARGAWGRGYATEAGDAVVDAVFAGDRRRDEILSGYLDGNARSASVLAKLGFLPAGSEPRPARALAQEVLTHRVRLTRERWQARRRLRLRSPRLSLRELKPADWRAVLRLAAGAPGAAPCGAPAWPGDEAGARRWVALMRYRGRPGFAAALCQRGRVVGLAWLGRPGPGAAPTCGCLLDPRQRGRGLATEALRALLSDAFARFDLAAVEAHAPGAAPETARLLARLGFSPAAPSATPTPARLEPAPNVLYRLDRQSSEAAR